MKSKLSFTTLTFLGIGLMILFSCNPRKRDTNNPENNSTEEVVKPVSQSYIYNFYIENSGSVKGYFNGKNNDAAVIIREIYDRLEEDLSANDSITLNYINNKIIPQATEVNKWLNTAAVHCNAAFSDLDKVLERALANTDNRNVSFVISDFCFESKDGDLRKAQSGITKIFAKALKSNHNLSVAIYKYDASFNGYYYPGRIKHIGKRPLYIWVLGPSNAIKKVSNLNTKQKPVHELYLQPYEKFFAKVETNNSRMTSRDRDCIIVKEWKKDRYEKGVYKANLHTSLKSIILSSNSLYNVNNYVVTPSEYELDKITINPNGDCNFSISSERPYSCTLVISYKIAMPNWVEKSNTETNVLPDDELTYGIKYLIDGVIDAYRKIGDAIFSIEFKLK